MMGSNVRLARRWPICVCALIAILAYAMLIPDSQHRADRLGATDLVMGGVMAAFSLAQLLFVPIISRWSDRVGRRRALLFSLSLFTVAFAIYSLAESLLVLTLARIVAGAAMSSIPVLFAMMSDVTDEARRAKSFGLLGACIGTGFILGPAIGGTLADRTHHSAAVLGLSCLVLSLVNLALATRFITAQSAAVVQQTPTPTVAPFAFAQRDVRVLLLSFFLASIAFSCLETTFVRFVTGQMAESQQVAGRLLGWIGIFDVAAQGLLIRRYANLGNGAWWIVGGMLAHAAVLWTVPFAPLWVPMLVAAAFIGMGQGMYVPCFSALLSSRSSEQVQGGMLGVIQAQSSLARVLASFGANWLFDEVAPWATYALASGLMVPALLVFRWGVRLVPAPQ